MIQAANKTHHETDQPKAWENAIERLFVDAASADEKLKLILLHRMMGTGGFDSDRIVNKIIDSLSDMDLEKEGEDAMELQGFILGISLASESI